MSTNTHNEYLQSESIAQTIERSFRNIAQALEIWRRTDLKKDVRVREINRAQEIILIVLLSMNNAVDSEFTQAFINILQKTSHDITQALANEPVDFRDHIRSFNWMADQMSA